MKNSNTTKALRKLTLATTTAAMALGMVSALEGYAQTGGTGGDCGKYCSSNPNTNCSINYYEDGVLTSTLTCYNMAPKQMA